MSQEVRAWFLTGEPGIGKTSVLAKAVTIIKSKGYTAGGVVSREVRVGGERIGFDLIDIATESRGTLASVSTKRGPKLGKYRVNLEDVANVGAKAIQRAIGSSDLVVCDEIGPMELYSPEFRRAVGEAIESGKPMLGVIHKRVRDDLVVRLRSLPFVQIIEVTSENRDTVSTELAEKVLQVMEA